MSPTRVTLFLSELTHYCDDAFIATLVRKVARFFFDTFVSLFKTDQATVFTYLYSFSRRVRRESRRGRPRQSDRDSVPSRKEPGNRVAPDRQFFALEYLRPPIRFRRNHVMRNWTASVKADSGIASSHPAAELRSHMGRRRPKA